MNISGVHSSYTQQIQAQFMQHAKDFTAIKSALKSGDLTAAQQALATFEQQMQGATQAQAVPLDPNVVIGNDLQTLQTTLQSGDLAGAQQAFASLKQDLASVQPNASAGVAGFPLSHPHHHHHHIGRYGHQGN